MKAPRGMTAGGTLILVILLLIALGVVWISTGGPNRSSSHSGPFLQLPWPLGRGGTTTSFSFPHFVVSTPEPETEETGGTSGTETRLPAFLSRFGRGTIVLDSPYAGKVSVEISNARSSDPKSEYVTIRTAPGLEKSITLTGWSLVSGATGITVKIGEGALIPFLGQVNVEAPIRAGSDTVVHVVTGRSPNGTSFRVNRCTGYFEQFQDFTPALQIECPSPRDELDRYPGSASFNDACHNFVTRLSRCALFIKPIPADIGPACQNFVLNTLSYNGCINAHKNDPDFYRNEWRLYAGRDQELWKNTREEIILRDENGKVVDVASYSNY